MIRPEECAVVIPCLNEEAAILPLVEAVRKFISTVIVVDDGSTDATRVLALKAGAFVVRHEISSGKGVALNTGWLEARNRGFHWALVMDGDGQHLPEDIPSFLATGEVGRADLVVGNRFSNAKKIPWFRRQINRWMSLRLSKLAGLSLPDSQCGFRLMNLDVWAGISFQTTHYEIESEMLHVFAKLGHPIRFIPVTVVYGHEQSKISPWRDTLRWFRWLRSVKKIN